MTIPVMYEQLKREKLRLHKARSVLASWGELGDRLRSHLGAGVPCCMPTGFLSLLQHNPVSRTYIEL